MLPAPTSTQLYPSRDTQLDLSLFVTSGAYPLPDAPDRHFSDPVTPCCTSLHPDNTPFQHTELCSLPCLTCINTASFRLLYLPGCPAALPLALLRTPAINPIGDEEDLKANLPKSSLDEDEDSGSDFALDKLSEDGPEDLQNDPEDLEVDKEEAEEAPKRIKIQTLTTTAGVHHRHRAMLVFLRKEKVERLDAPPTLFNPPNIVSTNSMTSEQFLTDRISKVWGYNVGPGPVWNIMEDRSCFKDPLEGEENIINESFQASRSPSSDSDTARYSPTDAVLTDDSQLQPPAPAHYFLGPHGRQTRVEMAMFDSHVTLEYVPGSKSFMFNVGSPAWGADWCPTYPDDRPRKTQHSLVGTLFQRSAKLPLNLVRCEFNSKYMHTSSSFSVCLTVALQFLAAIRRYSPCLEFVVRSQGQSSEGASDVAGTNTRLSRIMDTHATLQLSGTRTVWEMVQFSVRERR
ncbi:hypothetical protein DFJ58DRAFT_912370 [Suillus subalutaceus]|uniref:uncharacterized protein n=1 Tax=Suillus subalutaceus TaxID=48586 RepID=UPI001B8748F7|nr:uncharacterized protein DFJ58DRAFT_912370 [Suillus subalutaceus]KAG1863616.1 hypothetical protein DFJ58DRAFT_912370 [Suillus subalutaceus]